MHAPVIPAGRSGWFNASLAVALAVLMLLAGLWLAYANFLSANDGGALGDKVRSSRFAAGTLMSALKDAETGQRGYLLTKNPAYLQPYDDARAHMGSILMRLEQVSLGDPVESARVAGMRELANAKLAELGRTVAMANAGQTDAAVAIVRTDQGKQIMDALRTEADALWKDADAELLTAQTRARSVWSWIAPAGLGVLSSLLLGGVALGQKRQQWRVATSMAQLARFTHAFDLVEGKLMSLDGRITFWSVGNSRLFGYRPEEAIGKISHELLGSRFQQPLAEIKAILLREGQWQGEVSQRRRDGSEITVISHWALDRGMAGEPDAIIAISLDISPLIHANEEREQSRALLQAVIKAAPWPIYAKNRIGQMLLANPSAMTLIGKSWDEVRGRTNEEFLDDKAQARAVMANDSRVMDTLQADTFEEQISGEGLQQRVWLSTKTPMLDKDGVVIGLVGVSVEMTERKRAEERQRLLVHELNHRVKNTLLTVQAIAFQTLRQADPIIRATLEARLLALASAHDVLTLEHWAGANLHDVVSKLLSPHGGLDDRRFKVQGPPIRLLPGAALALAMGLHELMTNALKYGALTSDAGVVEIHWDIVPGAVKLFRLTWTERGGPVVMPPNRHGFGTRLIEHSLAQDLAGTARIEFQPSGVVCTVETALGEIVFPVGPISYPRIGVMQES